MKEILEILVKNLVNDGDSVEIEEDSNDKVCNFKVKIPKNDIGRAIGKQGKTARAIRTVMRSISVQYNKKVNIEFGEK